MKNLTSKNPYHKVYRNSSKDPPYRESNWTEYVEKQVLLDDVFNITNVKDNIIVHVIYK